MIDAQHFEDRLLDALTEVDARRAGTSPAFQHREPRRRVGRTLALAVAASFLVFGTGAVATATGLFSSAPVAVKRIFAGLDGTSGSSVDGSKAVQIGVIDDHLAYAAPTSNGGFCLYFASNPRSGPTGTACISRGAGASEAVFSVLPGTDGGVLFGRVGEADAASVDITFPDDGGVLDTRVGESGFFAVKIPERAMRTLMIELVPGSKGYPPTKDGRPILSFDLTRVPAISVIARDAQGNQVAHGVPVAELDPVPSDQSTPR